MHSNLQFASWCGFLVLDSCGSDALAHYQNGSLPGSEGRIGQLIVLSADASPGETVC